MKNYPWTKIHHCTFTKIEQRWIFMGIFQLGHQYTETDEKIAHCIYINGECCYCSKIRAYLLWLYRLKDAYFAWLNRNIWFEAFLIILITWHCPVQVFRYELMGRGDSFHSLSYLWRCTVNSECMSVDAAYHLIILITWHCLAQVYRYELMV